MDGCHANKDKTLSHLPHEILFLIIEQSGFEQLMALSCVSKAFCQNLANQEIYKYFCTTVGAVPPDTSEAHDWRNLFSATFLTKTVNWLLLGTVDSGKSTLYGRLAHGLNADNPAFMAKFKEAEDQADWIGKGSFKYAFLSDTYRPERERGVTIQTHIHHIVHPDLKKAITIFDAPGHRDFHLNVCRHFCVADHVIVVLAAQQMHDKSYLRMNVRLACLYQFKHVVFFVNKLDCSHYNHIDPVQAYTDAKEEMERYAQATGLKATILFIPGSAWLGHNVVQPMDPRFLLCPDLQSITLWEKLKAVTNAHVSPRALGKPLRLILLKKTQYRYGEKSQNPTTTFYYVSPHSGTLRVGDEILIDLQVTCRAQNGRIRGGHHNCSSFKYSHEVFRSNVLTMEFNHKPIHAAFPGDIVSISLSQKPPIWELRNDTSCNLRIPSGCVFFPSDKVEFVSSFTAHVIGIGRDSGDYTHLQKIQKGSRPLLICHGHNFTGTITSIKKLKHEEEDDDYDEKIQLTSAMSKDSKTCTITVQIDGRCHVWLEPGLKILLQSDRTPGFCGVIKSTILHDEPITYYRKPTKSEPEQTIL